MVCGGGYTLAGSVWWWMIVSGGGWVSGFEFILAGGGWVVVDVSG